MTEHECYYRRVMGAIGATMLVFLGFLMAFIVLDIAFEALLLSLTLPNVWRYVIGQLFYGAGYMLTFMLPVAFLRLFLKKNRIAPQPMYLEPRFSRYVIPMILSCIALCTSAAIINQTLTGVFDLFGAASPVDLSAYENVTPYELVLQFIVICVVPGFCEEFLFRGAILTNCLPFGRGNAIIISSLLFAVMHQNFDQILYTFVVGVALGLIYERTGSIWVSTLAHICNNFVSVLQLGVVGKLGIGVYGNLVWMIVDCVILTLGFVSTVLLILKFCSKKQTLRDGVFGKDLPVSDSYATHPISAASARKLFCTPTIVIFISLSLVIMILTAVLMPILTAVIGV